MIKKKIIIKLKEQPNPLKQGSSHLTTFQQEVVDECLKKTSGGLSLPMGSGKTLISLIVALRQTTAPILVVAAKNLIASWEFEIHKFFDDTLKYIVLHSDKLNIDTWSMRPETRLVLTTGEVLAKYYKKFDLHTAFIHRLNVGLFAPPINEYRRPVKPLLSHPIGGGHLYSKQWGCLIIDEAQKFTNILTLKCQGLGAICATYRWALSGTMFDEPKTERILGYHVLLDLPNMPRTLPDTHDLIHSVQFKGMAETLVFRTKNLMFVPHKINETIVAHQLSIQEAQIYLVMKHTLQEITAQATQLSLIHDTENARKFNSYKLAMISYLRQALVCPLIPLATIAIDMADFQAKSELSQILSKELEGLGLREWLDDENSILSTRIQKILEHIDKHPDQQIVLFSCFRTSLEVLETFIKNRPICSIDSSMTTSKRGEEIERFKQIPNAVLLLTYDLGAEGLNLQFASTVFLLDFWWNAGKTQQAIARVFRYGQTKDVNIYYFTANTGVEKALFQKQKNKLQILEELQHGPKQTAHAIMKMDEVISLITNVAENETLIKEINYVKNN